MWYNLENYLGYPGAPARLNLSMEATAIKKPLPKSNVLWYPSRATKYQMRMEVTCMDKSAHLANFSMFYSCNKFYKTPSPCEMSTYCFKCSFLKPLLHVRLKRCDFEFRRYFRFKFGKAATQLKVRENKRKNLTKGSLP